MHTTTNWHSTHTKQKNKIAFKHTNKHTVKTNNKIQY